MILAYPAPITAGRTIAIHQPTEQVKTRCVARFEIYTRYALITASHSPQAEFPQLVTDSWNTPAWAIFLVNVVLVQNNTTTLQFINNVGVRCRNDWPTLHAPVGDQRSHEIRVEWQFTCRVVHRVDDGQSPHVAVAVLVSLLTNPVRRFNPRKPPLAFDFPQVTCTSNNTGTIVEMNTPQRDNSLRIHVDNARRIAVGAEHVVTNFKVTHTDKPPVGSGNKLKIRHGFSASGRKYHRRALVSLAPLLLCRVSGLLLIGTKLARFNPASGGFIVHGS